MNARGMLGVCPKDSERIWTRCKWLPQVSKEWAMLTYRGGGGRKRRSSSASSHNIKSWLTFPTLNWKAPIYKTTALRCAFVLIAVPLAVMGLLLVRLVHEIAVRTCIALLSILPRGCPGLLYSSDHVGRSPSSRLFVFEVDRGRDAFDVLQSLIAHDCRFGMKLVYSRLGANIWKTCDESWNFRDQVRQQPPRDGLCADYMSELLSDPLHWDQPPWRAIRTCEGRILVLLVHTSLADALKKCDDPDPCLYTPKKEVDPLVLLSRKIEGWIHAWFSHPTLVLHRVRSQLCQVKNTIPKDFNVASTRIIPTSFLEALAVCSEGSREDVLLSCAAGALRRSFQHLVGTPPQEVLAGIFSNPAGEKAVLFPLWNAEPVTRLKRMASASKDPLRLMCQVSVSCSLAAGWRLPGGEILKSLHYWTLDSSGVYAHINETKEGLHVDISSHKNLLGRSDILAAAFEREVQDLAMAVGIHRQHVPLPSPTKSALDSQLPEQDFWSTKIQRVCQFQRKLASLVFSLQ